MDEVRAEAVSGERATEAVREGEACRAGATAGVCRREEGPRAEVGAETEGAEQGGEVAADAETRRVPRTGDQSQIRAVRLTMAVLLPGFVLGGHVYRRFRRAAEEERRRVAEVEAEAARLEAEQSSLNVQETSTAEEQDGSEKIMVWETVYEHGRDHDK